MKPEARSRSIYVTFYFIMVWGFTQRNIELHMVESDFNSKTSGYMVAGFAHDHNWESSIMQCNSFEVMK